MQHSKLLLASLLVIGSAYYASAFYNDLPLFRKNILPKCFNRTDGDSGPLLVDGQKYPLAHTLDNFISLIEKFEAANPEMKLGDMLFAILKNFAHENLLYSHSTGFRQNKPIQRFGTLEDLWEENRGNIIPQHVNPYDDDEICSLFYMLSHTVNDTALADEEESRTFPTPRTTMTTQNGVTDDSKSYLKDGVARADVRRTKYPREQGIVLIRSTGETVALSQVILGLYLGLTFVDRPLENLLNDKTLKDNGYDGDKNYLVSPLFIMTLADTLLMNKGQRYFVEPKDNKFGTNPVAHGYNNKDVGFGTDDICPTIFKLGENATALQTYSLIRGSTDGLLLGSIVKEISNQPESMRLSQILRSYYSPLGIRVPASTNKDVVYTSCDRQALLEPLWSAVEMHMGALLAILSESYNTDQSIIGEAQKDFKNKQSEIFSLPKDSCSREIKAENLYCETPVDVIIVLDTTDTAEIKLQQEIIGYMATELQLANGVSTATVYFDYLNETTANYLQELIPQTYSSACIGCHIAQKDITHGNGADRRTVLQALDNILESRKNEEKDLSGAPGKVVIYFNFQDKEVTDSRLQKVRSHFYDAHSDVAFIAVGRNEEVLKKYSGRNLFDIVKLVGDDKTSEIGATLAKKICLGPASLQYTDCEAAKDEKSARYDGYVTRSSVQHWGMDPKYFEKSYTAKLFFEAQDGHIQVCHNRATTRPELEVKNCQMTNSSTRRLQFTASNPCQGLSRRGCSPFYFSVIGVEPNEKDQVNNHHLCTDPDCQSVNQVKFTFSHEGVRCSGCSALLSNAVFLVISALLAYVFSTK